MIDGRLEAFSRRLARPHRAASHSASSACGITRAPARVAMKLVSPFQRGTMCQCKWPGKPGAGRAAQIQADVERLGLQLALQQADAAGERPLAIEMLRVFQLVEPALVQQAERSANGRCCRDSDSASRPTARCGRRSDSADRPTYWRSAPAATPCTKSSSGRHRAARRAMAGSGSAAGSSPLGYSPAAKVPKVARASRPLLRLK